jgi:hypothetical protein
MKEGKNKKKKEEKRRKKKTIEKMNHATISGEGQQYTDRRLTVVFIGSHVSLFSYFFVEIFLPHFLPSSFLFPLHIVEAVHFSAQL